MSEPTPEWLKKQEEEAAQSLAAPVQPVDTSTTPSQLTSLPVEQTAYMQGLQESGAAPAQLGRDAAIAPVRDWVNDRQHVMSLSGPVPQQNVSAVPPNSTQVTPTSIAPVVVSPDDPSVAPPVPAYPGTGTPPARPPERVAGPPTSFDASGKAIGGNAASRLRLMGDAQHQLSNSADALNMEAREDEINARQEASNLQDTRQREYTDEWTAKRDAIAAANKHYEDLRLEREKQSDELRNLSVDPDRFFKSQNAATKFGLGISLIAGGMLQGLSNLAENPGMKMLENARDTDIRAQEVSNQYLVKRAEQAGENAHQAGQAVGQLQLERDQWSKAYWDAAGREMNTILTRYGVAADDKRRMAIDKLFQAKQMEYQKSIENQTLAAASAVAMRQYQERQDAIKAERAMYSEAIKGGRFSSTAAARLAARQGVDSSAFTDEQGNIVSVPIGNPEATSKQVPITIAGLDGGRQEAVAATQEMATKVAEASGAYQTGMNAARKLGELSNGNLLDPSNMDAVDGALADMHIVIRQLNKSGAAEAEQELKDARAQMAKNPRDITVNRTRFQNSLKSFERRLQEGYAATASPFLVGGGPFTSPRDQARQQVTEAVQQRAGK